MLKQAPEYALARKLISFLSDLPEVGSAVFRHPYDSAEQVNNLLAAASSYNMTVGVIPQPSLANVDKEARANVLSCRVAVLFMARANALGLTSASEATAALAAFVMSRVLNWSPSGLAVIGACCPSVEEVRILSPSDYRDLPEDMSGRVVVFSLPVNFDYYFSF